jgi:hypothetical protein
MRLVLLLLFSIQKEPNLTNLVMVLVHGYPHIEPLQEVLGPLGHGIGVLDDLLLQYNALLGHPILHNHGLGDPILPQWLNTWVPISLDHDFE